MSTVCSDNVLNDIENADQLGTCYGGVVTTATELVRFEDVLLRLLYWKGVKMTMGFA